MGHQSGKTVHHVGHGEEHQPSRRRLLDVVLPVAHALTREDDEVHHVSGDADREDDRMYYGSAVIFDELIVQLFAANVLSKAVIKCRCSVQLHRKCSLSISKMFLVTLCFDI